MTSESQHLPRELKSKIVELENELHHARSHRDLAAHAEQRVRFLQEENKQLLAQYQQADSEKKGNAAATRANLAQLDIKLKELTVNSATRYKELELKRTEIIGSSSSIVNGTFRLSPDSYYGSQHHKDIRIMERIAMNQGSLSARQSIALAASNLRLNLEEILVLSRGALAGIFTEDAAAAAKDWNIRSLLSLARVITDQNLLPNDKADAIAIYELALRVFGIGRIDSRARYLFIETLQEVGDFERADELCKAFNFKEADLTQHTLMQCNKIMSTLNDEASWLEEINQLYRKDDLATLSLEAPNGDILLDRLVVNAEDVRNGPLVTVMMPTHNGSEWIKTAINSVIRQTWRNLELIVVDDHSDADHWNYLQNFARQDERIRLFRMESNQGAYRARNLAFSKARGEYVTVHDDDDWSHPQKIELQVKQLVADPSLPGNMSFQTRINDVNQFLRINDNPSFNQKNYSSMMFPRNLVEQAGQWDDINRAADAEFHDRIQLLTDKKIAFVESAPLSFMRARSGSLTSGEIRRGALDYARQSFGILYGNWHRKLRETGASIATETKLSDPKNRFYQVPANMRPGLRNQPFDRFDVVFVTDFRFPGGNSSLIAEEIKSSAESGLKIGVVHLASPVLRANHVFNEKVHEAIENQSVSILSLTDSFETDLLVVRNPTVLQYLDNLKTTIKSNHIAIVANTASMSTNGKNYCYELRACLKNASTAFGENAVLYPESPQTRKTLLALEPNVELSPLDWPGFIDVQKFVVENRPKHVRPVVGRHSRDHHLKWPENLEQIEAAYIQPGNFDTLILGGAETIKDKINLDECPSVQVLEFGTREPADFLRDIDFWVYMHHPDLTESFGMSIIEAMASGCVVILPPYMEELFQDAAIYRDTSSIRATVEKYWKDHALYSQQANKSLNYVNEHFSVEAFLSRIRNLKHSPSKSTI